MQRDDETLMAFADGALSEEEAQEIRAELAKDPALAARVEAFRTSRQVVAALPLAPVSSALEARIRGLAAAPPPSNVVPLRRPVPWVPMLGAAAAALVIGVFLGPLLRPAPGTPGFAPSAAVSGLLDRQPSGQIAAVEGGEVEVIATFHAGSGALCREYEERRGAETLTAIACRANGDWALQLAVSGGAAGGYAPASGAELVEGWLAAQSAGAPLSSDAEAAALAGR